MIAACEKGKRGECYIMSNDVVTMASITEDIQIIDIPMNYAALYMRHVIFSSLALIYHIWLDIHESESRKENR